MAAKKFFNRIEDYETLKSSDLMLIIMFGGALVFAAMLGIIWALWGIYDGWQLTKTGIKTIAEVTDRSSYSTKNGVRYNPIITFTTVDQKIVKVKLTDNCSAEIGHKIAVIYHATNPEGSVRVNTPKSLLYDQILLIIIAFAIGTPFAIEIRKMMIAGGLLPYPQERRTTKPTRCSNQPSIAELNRHLYKDRDPDKQ